VRATTIVVIVTVFLFGAYFGILDWVFTRAVGWILQWGGGGQ
jgi:preprotein translocase SecE subunit